MTKGLSRMSWGRGGWRRGANTAQSASPPRCQTLGQGQARQLEVSGDLWAWLPWGGLRPTDRAPGLKDQLECFW